MPKPDPSSIDSGAMKLSPSITIAWVSTTIRIIRRARKAMLMLDSSKNTKIKWEFPMMLISSSLILRLIVPWLLICIGLLPIALRICLTLGNESWFTLAKTVCFPTQPVCLHTFKIYNGKGLRSGDRPRSKSGKSQGGSLDGWNDTAT